MSGQPQQNRFPAWLAPVVVALLGGQLALLYVQGSQLHSQRGELRELRQDIQALTDSLDQAMPYDEGHYTPAHPARQHRNRKPDFRRVILEEGQEPAAREVEASRKSAEKAVEQARDTQQKLSISENARKAEEKAKAEAEKRKWGPYIGLGIGLALLAILGRSFLRRNAS